MKPQKKEKFLETIAMFVGDRKKEELTKGERVLLIRELMAVGLSERRAQEYVKMECGPANRSRRKAKGEQTELNLLSPTTELVPTKIAEEERREEEGYRNTEKEEPPKQEVTLEIIMAVLISMKESVTGLGKTTDGIAANLAEVAVTFLKKLRSLDKDIKDIRSQLSNGKWCPSEVAVTVLRDAMSSYADVTVGREKSDARNNLWHEMYRMVKDSSDITFSDRTTEELLVGAEALYRKYGYEGFRKAYVDIQKEVNLSGGEDTNVSASEPAAGGKTHA